MWSNQYRNPDYSFLKPENDLHPYFRYTLWREVEQLAEGQKEKQHIPEGLKDSWLKLLGQLNGSELSIKKCQGWLMSYSQYAGDLAELLAVAVGDASDPYEALNIFCLVDDILHRVTEDSSKDRSIINSFELIMNRMFEKAYSLDDIDLSERLRTMISIWSKDKIFSPSRAEQMIQYLYGNLRDTLKKPESDTSLFPVGLIPELCREIRDLYPPYTPLDSGDIQKYGQPDPPDMDDYLKARIKSFYDIIDDYRPGMSYDQICTGVLLQTHRTQPHTPCVVPLNDGSYKGSRGSSAKGLGYEQFKGQDNTFIDFRNTRKYASYNKM